VRRTKALWAVLALALATVLTLGLLPASAAPDVTVKITHFQYRARNPVVAVGGQVAVFNVDGRTHGIPHSLTADDHSFGTGVFVRGTQNFLAPSEPGHYPFHCDVHPEMHGVLHVEA
jgi:plastocyanin